MFVGSIGNKRSHAGWHARILAREIGTDGLPGVSAIGGLKENVGCVIEDVRIHGREHQRLGAVGAELGAAQRNRRDILYLAGGPVELRDLAAATAIDYVGIERVRRDVAVLNGARRMPISERNRAVITPAVNANGAALLLAAADLVGKCIAD